MNNKVKYYRSKIFDIKSVYRSEARESLPVKSAAQLENMRFIDGAFEITDYGELLKDMGGVPIPPPPEVCPRVIPLIVDGEFAELIAFGGEKTYHKKITSSKPWQLLVDTHCGTAVNIEQFGKRALLLTGITANYTYDGQSLSIYPRSTAGIYEYAVSHYGRIFAASLDRRLYFSDESDPLNWNVSIDEGGYLGFDVNSGDIAGLVSFNDYVYIFTEFNIYRLTVYAEQENFVLKKLDLDIGRAIKGSVANCSGSAVFLTTRGLMAFDGYSVRLINDAIRSDIRDSRVVNACGVGRKYYLALDKKMYIYDCETDTVSTVPMGYDFALSSVLDFKYALVYTNHNIYGDMGSSLYLYSDTPGRGKIAKTALVESGEFDFGCGSERKIIKSVVLREGIVGTLFITADGREHSYNIGGRNRIPIGLTGMVFNLRMELYPFDKPLPSPIMEYGIEVL